MISDMPTPDQQNAQASVLDAALARLADVLTGVETSVGDYCGFCYGEADALALASSLDGIPGTCCPRLPPRSRTTGATTTTCTASSRLTSLRCLSTTTCIDMERIAERFANAGCWHTWADDERDALSHRVPPTCMHWICAGGGHLSCWGMIWCWDGPARSLLRTGARCGVKFEIYGLVKRSHRFESDRRSAKPLGCSFRFLAPNGNRLSCPSDVERQRSRPAWGRRCEPTTSFQLNADPPVTHPDRHHPVPGVTPAPVVR
jgi:hypothetical protein